MRTTQRRETGGRRRAHEDFRTPAACCVRTKWWRLSCPSRQHCATEQRPVLFDGAGDESGPRLPPKESGTRGIWSFSPQQVCPSGSDAQWAEEEAGCPLQGAKGEWWWHGSRVGGCGGHAKQSSLDIGCVAFRECAVKDAPHCPTRARGEE